jgi:putative FmdB family regulatory protein
MPTYEYECTSCGRHIEVFQRFTEDALTTCEACGGALRKVFHPAGIVFKGSGFYATDSRKSSSPGSASGSGSSNANKDDGSSSSNAKKDDGSSSPKGDGASGSSSTTSTPSSDAGSSSKSSAPSKDSS